VSTDVRGLRHVLEQRKGRKALLESSIEDTQTRIKEKKKSLRQHERAREIIRHVGLKTQQGLQYHISEITSLALQAVFDNPYELVVEFVQRRNKTECDLAFARDGMILEPLESSGGGAVDVAAFSLRVASWSMQRPRTRAVLILDEPFKQLKGDDANRRALEMVHEVSEKLGLQVIMVSDERTSREDIIDAADRVFDVSLSGGVSKVVRT
jgi:DNA repair exonuclease SbcCD ATPase subunit